MFDELSIFDFIDGGEEFKPKKSDDWKWTFADYPKQKNGLKVFLPMLCLKTLVGPMLYGHRLIVLRLVLRQLVTTEGKTKQRGALTP